MIAYQAIKEWRRLDVGGVGVPGVELVRWSHQRVPALIHLLWRHVSDNDGREALER